MAWNFRGSTGIDTAIKVLVGGSPLCLKDWRSLSNRTISAQAGYNQDLIDIHSHVLWGLDDGAPTFEDSLAMLRMAEAHGTRTLVATPHASPNYRFEPELVAERIAGLSAAMKANGGELELHTGCDFHLSYDNIQDAIQNPAKYTINQKNYLLVEFSDLLIFKNTREIFERLAGVGMIPVVTHPERNDLLRQRVEEIAAWVESGAYVQVTAMSLTGGFGRRAHEFSKLLLDRGLVHFIASDGHDCDRRPPRMDEARAWLAENYDEVVAEALCVNNPRSAVNGDALEKIRIEVTPPVHKWYKLWR
jgi:protein-tyrosine phosphatase